MDEYIVSARKYRPLNFDSVIGQHALTMTLKNAVASGKLAHAYLFCGPRGVGKTTCARIFAKAINCLNPSEDGAPCGQCESCKAFNEQRSLNIHELDAASNNSVEDIRELIQQVQIPPQIGRYKVFIIDEVHMLSSAAFNAFLKTLEEPPSYVIFILATTEKHKILPTILSRCQVYDFQRITVDDTIGHLKRVAEKEGVSVDEEALNLIAQKADGGMRDALSIFDQMVSFTGGTLTYENVCESLNVLNTEYYFQLVDHFLHAEIKECLLLLNNILKKGFDAGNFISGLSLHMRNLLVAKDEQSYILLEMSRQMQERYQQQAKLCSPKFIYQALKICNDCDQAYRTSKNKRLQVEICLIQVAQLNQEDEPSSGPGPATTLKPVFDKQDERQNVQNQAPHIHTEKVTSVPEVPEHTDTKSAPPSFSSTANTGNNAPLMKIRMRAFPGQAKKENEERAIGIPSIRRTPINEQELPTVWYELIGQMPKEETAMATRMRNIHPQLVDDHTIRIEVNNQQVKDDIMNLMNRFFLSFLRNRLENDEVVLVCDVAKVQEVERIYSKPERLRMLKERNHYAAELTDRLHLKLS